MQKIDLTFRTAMGMAIAGIFGGTALAQQSITSYLGLSYEQDFDNTGGTGNGGFDNTLNYAATGVDYTALPTGWVAGTYRAGNGSSGTRFWSYGNAAGDPERALGSQGNSASQIFGAVFQNNTGSAITQIYVQYTGEQWRNGNSATDKLDFSYSVNPTAGSLTAGTWTNVDTLDFTSPVSATTGALDGNVSPNRTTLGTLITLTSSVPVGGLFGIRWQSFDSPGTTAEDGLAVDDLIIMVPEAWHPAAVAGVGLLGLMAWQRRRVRNAC